MLSSQTEREYILWAAG